MNKREDINLYVIELLKTVVGLQTFEGAPCVFRDRGELPPREKTPGIIYLDGTVSRKTQMDGYNLSEMPPAVFTTKPEILLALTPRDDVGNTVLNGVSNPAGEEMALFEERILAVLLGDENLVAMLGDNGSVVYDGFESDMRNGSTIGATGPVMIFKFAISYVLDPSDLRNV